MGKVYSLKYHYRLNYFGNYIPLLTGMIWNYFRWTGEVAKGMECIGNRMPFSKKGKCLVILRTATTGKRIAQVCKNSLVASKYVFILNCYLSLMDFWYLNTFLVYSWNINSLNFSHPFEKPKHQRCAISSWTCLVNFSNVFLSCQ